MANRIESLNTLKVYEVDRTSCLDKVIDVESHWNDSDMVCITIEGISYTVRGRDLIKAIQNAQNV